MHRYYSTDGTKCAAEEPTVLPVEIAVVAALMTLGVLFAPVNENASTALNETLLFGFLGFVLFIAAKISLYRSGRLATWGPSRMRLPFKLAYLSGYALMGISSGRLLI